MADLSIEQISQMTDDELETLYDLVVTMIKSRREQKAIIKAKALDVGCEVSFENRGGIVNGIV